MTGLGSLMDNGHMHAVCLQAPYSPVNGLQSFYSDFARVADDESRHLSWCLQRLDELGYAYGDMVAHSILWDGAQASSGGSHALQSHAIPVSQYTCLNSLSARSSHGATCTASLNCVAWHHMAACAAR